MSNATHRFDDRVQDYLRGRPGYPPGLISALELQVGLRSEWAVADIGAGTGLLSQRFLEAGCVVLGVEPSPPMAAAGRALLGDSPRFSMRDGRAEATGLPDGAAELVVAGQAFHWFDVEGALREWQRILRPPRAVALIWNRRPLAGTPFAADYEAFLRTWGMDYAEVSESYEDPRALARVFAGGAPTPVVLPHVHRLDRAGLQARLRSCSYLPGRGHPRYAPMMAASDALFEAHARDDTVEMPYDAVMYAGSIQLA
jgi:SAM-dependent methyltransferase